MALITDMAVSHNVWKLLNIHENWLAEIGIKSGLDYPI